MMTKAKVLVGFAVAAAVIGGSIALAKKWPADDQALHAALVGKWRAVDPDNAALHHRKTPVKTEDAEFKADGKLTYTVVLKTDANGSKGEPWGWEVKKGRLLIRDLGEGSAKDQLPGLRFAVNRSELSVRRKDYPVKVFERVD